MVTWHPLERTALVRALRTAGPGTPTLCTGWRTEHLAAHVVLRESRLVTSIGVVLPPFAGVTDRAVDRLAADATATAGYERLVQRVEAGGPSWHPAALGGDSSQLLEMLVHGLDVRRALPVDPGGPERSAEHLAAVRKRLAGFARLRLRGAGLGVTLVDDTGWEQRVRPATPAGDVVVRGPLEDLALLVFGRTGAARVALEGPGAGRLTA